MKYFIWGLVILLIIGWVLGFLVFEILGALIHILLVAALILAVYHWFSKRKVD